MISNEELARRMAEVRKHCVSSLLLSAVHQEITMNLIASIIRDASRSQLQSYEVDAIIVGIMKILFHYDESLYSANGNLCEWKRRRKKRAARACYYGTLKIYIPEKSLQVTEAIIDVMYHEKLWEFETFCFEIMCDLLEHGAPAAVLINKMCDKIESPDVGIQDTRAIIRILYELLDISSWPETEDTVTIVERILKLFHKSITDHPVESGFAVPYRKMKKGLEVCIRNIAKNLTNNHLLVVVCHMCSWTVQKEISDDLILDFGSTLEYTAYMHRASLYEKTLTPKLFPLLMQMIGSQSKIVSLLGNRVLQYLIDRGENKTIFDTPRIFFEKTEFNLKLGGGQCYKEDKHFLKVHREILHDSLLKSIINHSTSRMNLESTYCTICLIAIEVPCGFTAAALVCLAMNMQDVTLEENSDRRENDYHIHATVIAIMSLLCWIHKAKVFYSCVNKIMMERAQWAPHLNPPIQSQYNFAIHHVLWDKPEFFFVDWEARYGLWKCFRLRENSEADGELTE